MFSFNEKKNGDKDVNDIVEEHIPFIIKSISSVTGRYVSIENDEEFSVGILAFVEALEKYDETKGAFLAFAKLVISSRIKSFLSKENKYIKIESMESLMEAGVDFSDASYNPTDNKEELTEEIFKFKSDLKEFGMTLEDLVEESPKHEDTRKNAIGISEKVSKDEPLTTFIFHKKRLPIKQISLKYTVTEKILKRSKKFILSVVIIFFKNYRNLGLWVKDRR